MSEHYKLDHDGLSVELRLLLTIASHKNESQENQEMETLSQQVDWEVFADLAEHHKIYPTLYTQWLAGKASFIPADVIGRFEQAYQANTIRMMHLTAEMIRVCRLFRDQDIRSIVLKGPVLAGSIYGDLSLRTSKDLDILVPKQHVKQAEQLLEKLGYEPFRESETLRTMENWKWWKHHSVYVHPVKRTQIELHWKLNSNMGKEPTFEQLWERREDSSLDPSIHSLGLEDLFLFLVSHGARHAWFRLRWLADIDKLLEQPIDYPKLLSQLQAYKFASLGGQALILAKLLFQSSLPKALEPLLQDKKAWLITQQALFLIDSKERILVRLQHVKGFLNAKRHYYLELRTSPFQKFNYLFYFIFPQEADIKLLPLSKRFLFLYFPLRPFLWMIRRWNRWRQTTNG